MRWISLIPLAALAACTQFPQLDGTLRPEAAAADYPALAPIAPQMAQARRGPGVGAGADPQAAIADMTSRIARLRGRAAGLRRPVIPAPVRARMLRGVATDALQ